MSPRQDRTADDYLQEFRADPTNAPLALYTGAALDDAGRSNEALAVWTLGDDANPALRTVRLHPQANNEMRALSERANNAICTHFNTLYQDTIIKSLNVFPEENAAHLDRLRGGIWLHYHQDASPYRVRHQRPEIYYLPDLEATPIHPIKNGALPGAQEIEAAFADIKAEYERALATGAATEPYVHAEMPGTQWSRLAGTLDWAAVYLYYNADPTPNTDQFPQTLKALSHTDLLKKNGGPVEIFFSRLKPGAHIPPHCGLTNTRLTVHLPITVPEDCSIRVGEETHHWREGTLVAFDDSFEHEAWNKSDAERVVLIFEVHHPGLSALERHAISAVYEAFDSWVASRTSVIGLGAEPT